MYTKSGKTSNDKLTWIYSLYLFYFRSLCFLVKIEPKKFLGFVVKVVVKFLIGTYLLYNILFHPSNYFLWLFVFTIFVTFIILRQYEFYSLSHVPGPKPSFLSGNFNDLCKFGWEHRHYALLDLHQKYGPIVKLHMPLGKKPFVITNFVSAESNNPQNDALRPSKTLTPFSLMGLPKGTMHGQNRRIFSSFNSSSNFKLIIPKLLKHECDLITKWSTFEKDCKMRDPVNDLIKWGMGVVFDIFFQESLNEKEKEGVNKAVDDFVLEISKRTWTPMFYWFMNWERIKKTSNGFHLLRNLSKRLMLEKHENSIFMSQLNKAHTNSQNELNVEAILDETVSTYFKSLELVSSFFECEI